jgi:transposase
LASLEKKTLRASEQHREDVQLLRQHFFERFSGVDINDIIVLDESSCNTAMTRLYARAKKGQRAHAKAPRNWGKNITMLCAISTQKLETAVVFEGALNGEFFLTFVQQWLAPILRPGQVVVMDNLSSHKVSGVQEAIEARGARIEFLPPYSPDFSPIELMFSKVKTFLRGAKARTKEMLFEAIAAALETINSEELFAWFRGCGYLLE